MAVIFSRRAGTGTGLALERGAMTNQSFSRSRPTPVRCALVLAVLSAAPALAGAQAVDGRLAFTAGAATDARGVRSSAYTVAPSLSWRPDPRAALSVGGSWTRFAAAGWAASGFVGASTRTPSLGPLAVTFDASAAFTHASFGADYATADALPALELRGGPLFAYAGARAAAGRSSLTTVRQAPGGLPLGGTSSTSSTSVVARSALGPVLGGGVRVAGPIGAVTVGGRVERLRVDGATVEDRTLSATLAGSAVTLGGSLGMRRAPNERASYGSASLSLPLGSALALEGAVGSYPSSPLTGTPAGRFVAAGLSLRFGGAPDTDDRLPEASGAPAVPRGATRITLRAPDARRVELAGDFTKWQPVPATRAANGVWYVDVRLSPGQYRYAFRVDGAAWRIPAGATAVDDGFGGRSASLTVGDRGSK